MVKKFLFLVFVGTFSASPTHASLCKGDWWIDNSITTLYNYEKPELFPPHFKLDKSQFGKLTGDVDPPKFIYCRIDFEDGQIAYIRENDILGLYPKMMKKSERLSLLEKEKEILERIEELKKEGRAEAVKALSKIKKLGIHNGQKLWLRYAAYNFNFLDHFQVTDVSVVTDIIGENSSYTYVELPDISYQNRVIITFNYSGEKGSIDISMDIDSLDSIFSKTNPAKGWSKNILSAVRNGNILLGMTKDQVRASVGIPEQINRSGGPWGINEQWVYKGFYVYVDNGKVTSWQD